LYVSISKTAARRGHRRSDTAEAQINTVAGSLNAALEFVRGAAIPVETRTPRGSLDCLEPLAGMIGDARIAGIGESAHGLREFGFARHAITRFLVERLGFEVVCVETEYVGALTINRFIQGENIAEPDVMAVHHFGRLEEVKDFIRWLREHNCSTSRPVEFCGIDIYRSGTKAREALLAHLPTVATGPILNILNGAEPLTSQDKLTKELESLLERDSTNLMRPDAVEQTRRAIRNVLQSIELEEAIKTAGGTDRVDSFVRDGFLAENTLWSIRRMYPTQRIVLLTHNLHLQRYPYWDGSQPNPRGHLMGEVLAKEIGREMFVLGTTSGWRTPPGYTPKGPRAGYNVPNSPNSLDSVMDAGSPEQQIIDLRRATGMAREWLEGQQSMRDGADYLQVTPIPAFDALLHLGSLRISEGL
jgi:erythromycin esterase